MKKILLIYLILFSANSYSQPPVTAIFEVDMNLYPNSYSTVEFYRGGQSYPMINIGGNHYQYTTTVPGFQASNYTYKFKVDSILESFYGAESCVAITPTDTLRVINLNTNAPSIVCWETCSFCIIYGCTDSTASNFNPIATVDDSTCITCNYGCMDTLAMNFDSLATCQDTSCIYPQIFGCTDSTACNYDFLANIDDSSCGYIVGCTDSLAFNYDSLSTCNDSSCLYEYNVTFQLDLREQVNISYLIPEINGAFNGWCGNCAQMTDVNNDSIWEITIPLLEGSGPSGAPGWQYKFSADNWNIEENLFSGDPCTFTSSGYTNRYINVTQDTILDPVCWQSCVDCFGPQSSYNVTFQVDMTNVNGFSVPEINGEFNGWCGNCWPMTDVNGDDIWEFTTLIDTSLQEYKFSADNWNIQEQLDSSMSCVLSIIDSSGNVYVNRYLDINSDTILEVVCWEECTDCFIMQPSWDCNGQGDCFNPGTGLGLYLDSLDCTLNCQTTQLMEMNNNYIIYPNPTCEFIYINSKENIDNIIIYNKIGEIIFQIDNPNFMTEINFSGKSSDIYFMEIYYGTNIYREKVIYTQ